MSFFLFFTYSCRINFEFVFVIMLFKKVFEDCFSHRASTSVAVAHEEYFDRIVTVYH